MWPGAEPLELGSVSSVPTPTPPARPEAVVGSDLRRIIEDAKIESGLPLKDLTVLSTQVDPFRIDTPANHRDAEWLADKAEQLGVLAGPKEIHLRGLHYKISQRDDPWVMPNGERYINNDDCWEWMQGASKTARWLGYIPFEKIKDERNAEPVVRLFSKDEPWVFLSVGVHVDIPAASDIDPRVVLADFEGAQPYHLVFVGEKSSLEDELSSVANSYGADLYLPTGNISNTFIYQIAKNGVEDGRPMVIFYFSDFDPSGWNMPVEIGRKLQAFKANLFPELEFREYRAAVTADHVQKHSLPSTPLKPKEKRADKWKAAWGIEQTEIDAILALHPGLIGEMAKGVILPFYDLTLGSRVLDARRSWIAEAQNVVDANVDQGQLAQIRADAEAKLQELQDEIEAINDALRVDISDFDVPDIPAVPLPDVDEDDQPLPLFDSEWSYIDGTRALIESKAYRR